VAPTRPAAYAGIEERPQRCHVVPADAACVKRYLAERIGLAATGVPAP
jgi:hypothetical protein